MSIDMTLQKLAIFIDPHYKNCLLLQRHVYRHYVSKVGDFYNGGLWGFVLRCVCFYEKGTVFLVQTCLSLIDIADLSEIISLRLLYSYCKLEYLVLHANGISAST